MYLDPSVAENGLQFVIDNVDRLIVATSSGEYQFMVNYDLGSVAFSGADITGPTTAAGGGRMITMATTTVDVVGHEFQLTQNTNFAILVSDLLELSLIGVYIRNSGPAPRFGEPPRTVTVREWTFTIDSFK